MSTPTPCCGPCARSATKGYSKFAAGAGITVAGAPDRAAVTEQAKALVGLALAHGYRTDELIAIIQKVSA